MLSMEPIGNNSIQKICRIFFPNDRMVWRVGGDLIEERESTQLVCLCHVVQIACVCVCVCVYSTDDSSTPSNRQVAATNQIAWTAHKTHTRHVSRASADYKWEKYKHTHQVWVNKELSNDCGCAWICLPTRLTSLGATRQAHRDWE